MTNSIRSIVQLNTLFKRIKTLGNHLPKRSSKMVHGNLNASAFSRLLKNESETNVMAFWKKNISVVLVVYSQKSKNAFYAKMNVSTSQKTCKIFAKFSRFSRSRYFFQLMKIIFQCCFCAYDFFLQSKKWKSALFCCIILV